MSLKNQRQQTRARQRRQAALSNFIWIGLGVVVLAVLGVMVWQGVRPAAGESVPEMANNDHIPVDTDPGTYNSDPPTSGPHYADEAGAGFYEINNYQYPAGYLVHNLEHGYIIFWYNCDLLDEPACAGLQAQIRSMMDEFDGAKLIAYPWPSLDTPLVMTSWGRMQKFETFSVGQARAFIRANRNRAPEPNAP